MTPIRWSTKALNDFVQIHKRISEDSPAAADRQCDRIQASILQLSKFPDSGKRRPVRHSYELAVPGTPYVLMYRKVRDAIHLNSIKHGAQQR